MTRQGSHLESGTIVEAALSGLVQNMAMSINGQTLLSDFEIKLSCTIRATSIEQ